MTSRIMAAGEAMGGMMSTMMRIPMKMARVALRQIMEAGEQEEEDLA